MFGIGGFEFLIICLFAFLIFGPEKMPQVGRAIGRAIRQLRDVQAEVNRALQGEISEPSETDDEPSETDASTSPEVRQVATGTPVTDDGTPRDDEGRKGDGQDA